MVETIVKQFLFVWEPITFWTKDYSHLNAKARHISEYIPVFYATRYTRTFNLFQNRVEVTHNRIMCRHNTVRNTATLKTCISAAYKQGKEKELGKVEPLLCSRVQEEHHSQDKNILPYGMLSPHYVNMWAEEMLLLQQESRWWYVKKILGKKKNITKYRKSIKTSKMIERRVFDTQKSIFIYLRVQYVALER